MARKKSSFHKSSFDTRFEKNTRYHKLADLILNRGFFDDDFKSKFNSHFLLKDDFKTIENSFPVVRNAKKLSNKVQRTFSNFDLGKRMEKFLICNARKNRRSSIMRITAGKGASVKYARWTDKSRVRC